MGMAIGWLCACGAGIHVRRNIGPRGEFSTVHAACTRPRPLRAKPMIHISYIRLRIDVGKGSRDKKVFFSLFPFSCVSFGYLSCPSSSHYIQSSGKFTK